MALTIDFSDWGGLILHFMAMSLMSVGGAVTTIPEMHRFLVDRQGWLSDAEFSASIALAQAAPGPNILFVALLGWNVGFHAGGYGWGLLGAVASLLAILLPSTLIVCLAARWCQANRERRSVRAFKLGMAPVVIALVIASGWILARPDGAWAGEGGLWLITAISMLLVWRTRLHILWLLAAGAGVGALGWV